MRRFLFLYQKVFNKFLKKGLYKFVKWCKLRVRQQERR
ncbi:hypothetical protein [Bacillus phage vB_BceS-M2]